MTSEKSNFNKDTLLQAVKKGISGPLYNKFGFIVSLLTALALFFPMYEISFGTNFLISLFIPSIEAPIFILSQGGKGIFIALLIIAFFFYSGWNRKVLKTLVAATVTFLFINLIFGIVWMITIGGKGIDVLGIGGFMLSILSLLLLYAGFFKNIKKEK